MTYLIAQLQQLLAMARGKEADAIPCRADDDAERRTQRKDDAETAAVEIYRERDAYLEGVTGEGFSFVASGDDVFSWRFEGEAAEAKAGERRVYAEGEASRGPGDKAPVLIKEGALKAEDLADSIARSLWGEAEVDLIGETRDRFDARLILSLYPRRITTD